MGKLLVHITSGPEATTRAALGMLVARSALEGGHEVTLFLAGDAVALLRDETLDAGVGIGTGSLREHHNALLAGGATLYASGMSSKARGIADYGDRPIQMAQPTKLVELAFEADRVLTY